MFRPNLSLRNLLLFGAAQIAVAMLANNFAWAQDGAQVVPDGYRGVIGVKKDFAFTIDKNSPILKPGEELPTDGQNVVRLVPCGTREFQESMVVRTADKAVIDVHFTGKVYIDCDNHTLLRVLARDTFGTRKIDIAEVYDLRSSPLQQAAASITSTLLIADVYGNPSGFTSKLEVALDMAAKRSDGLSNIDIKELHFP